MRLQPKFLTISLLIFLSLSLFLSVASSSASRPLVNPTLDYNMAISGVKVGSILDHIRFFASIGSRVAGYPGSEEAAAYIYRIFNESGLTDLTYHEFPVTIPGDYGGDLTITRPATETITIYAFWPNLACPVTTPPEGISGNLIYAGEGHLNEFNGWKVEGSIVLMDMKSQRRWLNAMKLGAKAVIFIDQEDMPSPRDEFRMKVMDSIALDFPRYYVDRTQGLHLRDLITATKGDVEVTIRSTMKWEARKSKNVIGYVRGTDPAKAEKYILLTSHYDSLSFVPSLNPGAQDAVGISTLLELAGFYSQHPAPYTLVFVAFSGTQLGAEGSRWFNYDYTIGKWSTFGSKWVMQINLDLSTGTNRVFPTNGGSLWDVLEYLGLWWITTFSDYMFKELVPDIEASLGKKFNVTREAMSSGGGIWGGTVSWLRTMGGGQYPALDSEPIEEINGPGFSFTTQYDWRALQFTPHDAPEVVNLKNLQEQLEFILPAIYGVVNKEDLYPRLIGDWNIIQGKTQETKWTDASGTAAMYNYSKGWYTPIPNALVFTRISRGETYLGWAGLWHVTIADKDGKFFFPGLINYWRLGGYVTLAYVIDPVTGNTLYSPDQGRYMYQKTEVVDLVVHPFDFGYIVAEKAGSLVLFDFGEPEFQNVPRDASLSVSVFDFRTHTTPDSYGLEFTQYGGTGYTLAVVHTYENTPVEILIQAMYAMRYPLSTLINASREEPLGRGYMVKPGEQLTLTHSTLHYAENLYWMNDQRLGQLPAALRVQFVEHDRIAQLIQRAKEAIEGRLYDLAESLSAEAYTRARREYLSIRTSQEDFINAIPIFGLLLVPFAFLAERVLFARKGRSQIGPLLACYLVPFVLLWLVHPGMSLAADANMLFITLMVLVLSSLILAMIADVFWRTLQFLRTRALGVLAVSREVGFRGMLTTSFSVGTEHLRKRRLRAAMLLTTMILVTASLVAFTSMKALTITTTAVGMGEALYSGTQIRHPDWGRLGTLWGIWGGSIRGSIGEVYPGVGERLLEDLTVRYGSISTFAPRSWRYTTTRACWFPLYLRHGEKASESVFGILGSTAQDAEIFPIQGAMVEGTWILPNQTRTMIISQKLAKQLDVKTKDVVQLEGMNFTVVGIIDDTALLAIRDLDNEQIMPRDFKPPAWNVHLPPDQIVIIPYEDSLSLGGWVVNLSMKFDNPSQVRPAAEEMFNSRGIEILYSEEPPTVKVFSKALAMELGGWSFQVFPLVIGALVILTTALGAVQERSRDILIYSVVGLNPLQVAIIFLADALIIAIVGAIPGYLVGTGVSIVGSTFMKGFALNYASTAVVQTVLIGMAAALASAIYPVLKVAKVVTPSLERKWRIPVPLGNEWEITYPLSIQDDEAAGGILAYITEFLLGHLSEQSEMFWIRAPLSYGERDEPGRHVRSLATDMSLFPYEKGIRQDTQFIDAKTSVDNMHHFTLSIVRTQGAREDWVRLNKPFIDTIRKNLLLWTDLKPDERAVFVNKSKEMKKTV